MPSNYGKALTADEFQDLIAFLSRQIVHKVERRRRSEDAMNRRPVYISLMLFSLAPAAAQVTYEDLLKADPANWLTYSGSYHSQRHSLLKQVNTGNVQRAGAEVDLSRAGRQQAESVPLVVDGVMYVSQPNEVYALDARTGRLIWEYRHEPALRKGPNRGVAVYGNRVYFTTPDAHLVALDARTGNLLWQSKIAEAKEGYWSPAAPLVIKGKIIAGIAPGDYGMNGLLDAYDAVTGERLWRWNAIPKPGEPGNETWAGDSWKTAGGNTWLTGSYDPRAEPDLLGDRQSGAGFQRRNAQGRQPVHRMHGGAGCRYRAR